VTIDLNKPAGGWESVHLVEETPGADSLQELRVAEFDAATIQGKGGLMAAISDALEFPDYFGGNWDALDECLRDLAWIGAKGYVLLIQGAGAFWERDPELAAQLVSVWVGAARTWSEKGVPFHLVLVRGA